MNSVKIACVGAGYWGKNLVRVFHDLPDVHLGQVCDADPNIRAAVQQQYPDIETGADYDRLLADESLDAVVLACLLYTSPSPRDATLSRMPSSA